MGVTNLCRVHKEMRGQPSLLGRITLLAAATAASVLISGVAETADAPSGEGDAISIATYQDRNGRVRPSTPLNMVVRQPLGGVEPSATTRWQKRWQRCQILAASAGLVAVMCLSLAFLVLQCARKALFPRLSGSLARRVLSHPDLDEQLLRACVEDEEEDDEDGRDAGARQGEQPTETDGEAIALQTLEELRCTMTLGLQTLPYLPFDKKAFLIVLLVTICTQELVLYGIYSTPQLELERQRTMDFILHEGRQAVAQLYHRDQSVGGGSQGEKLLRLLEHFRVPRPVSNPDELHVEASICAYRISQCKEALYLLQHWVERSTPIPEQVSDRALRVLSYTRQTGKGRLKADVTANSWIEAVQAELRFFGIAEPRSKQGPDGHRRPLEEAMRKLKPRYRRLAGALARSIEFALSNQPLKQHLQEQLQQGKQHQLQGQTPTHRQQHPSDSQLPEYSAARSSSLQHLEEPAAVSGVGALISQPSWQVPYSTTSWHNTQQRTKEKEQSSFDYFKPRSALEAETTQFAPGVPAHTDTRQHISRASSDIRLVWRPLPPPPGSASFWRPTDPRIVKQNGVTSGHAPAVPNQHQMPYHKTAPPVITFPLHNPLHLHRLPTPSQPLPRPSLTSPRPPPTTEGESVRLPASIFQRPALEIPRPLLTTSHRLSGGWRRIPASRFDAPAPFWPPRDRHIQGNMNEDSSANTESLNPILRLIAEAFPTAGTH